MLQVRTIQLHPMSGVDPYPRDSAVWVPCPVGPAALSATDTLARWPMPSRSARAAPALTSAPKPLAAPAVAPRSPSMLDSLFLEPSGYSARSAPAVVPHSSVEDALRSRHVGATTIRKHFNIAQAAALRAHISAGPRTEPSRTCDQPVGPPGPRRASRADQMYVGDGSPKSGCSLAEDCPHGPAHSIW